MVSTVVEPKDRGTVLIISHAADIHATTVIERLQHRGEPVRLLDLATVPGQTALAIDYQSEDEPRALLKQAGQQDLDLSECRSIWWRRPQRFDLSAIGDAEAFAFAYNEWHEALAGLWQLADAFWVNNPVDDEVASHKAFQLREAAAVGLRIPRTLITSDPETARAFIDSLGFERTVFKVFSATEHTWRETRVLRREELEQIDDVRLAPVIFQEYIPAEVDLRITVVGDRVFPAAIYSQDTAYKVDFRMGMDDARIAATELPDDIVANLKNLLRRLNLVYGAVDMRRTPTGEHVFLEVNTAGQWLFVEQATGQPIAEAVAGALASASLPRD